MKHWPKLLIVDEKERWLEFSCDVLAKQDFEVRCVSNYNDVISILEFYDANLIILSFDKMLNESQALITQIRIRYPDKHILAFMNWLDRRSMRQFFLLGVADVAQKPFTAEELTSIVQEQFQAAERPRSGYQVYKMTGVLS